MGFSASVPDHRPGSAAGCRSIGHRCLEGFAVKHDSLTPGEAPIRLGWCNGLNLRGEALFEVAHDKERPFFVHVNDIVVRAVGTAFAVRLEAAQIDVTVTEGVVEVTEPAAEPGPAQPGPRGSRSETRRLAANERAVITRAGAPQVQSITPAEADRRLAWRQGMVSFDGESLQTAVAEINRHNRRQILVDDPALGAKPIVGVFRATDPGGFSVAAALALKASVIPDGDVIRLRPAAAQAPN